MSAAGETSCCDSWAAWGMDLNGANCEASEEGCVGAVLRRADMRHLAHARTSTHASVLKCAYAHRPFCMHPGTRPLSRTRTRARADHTCVLSWFVNARYAAPKSHPPPPHLYQFKSLLRYSHHPLLSLTPTSRSYIHTMVKEECV